MPDSVEDLIEAFGRAVLRRDHEALDVLLAPWIGVNPTLELFRTSFDSMAAEWELEPGLWPKAFEGSQGALSYVELRAPTDFPPGIEIPEQVTAENYVQWCAITLLPDSSDESIEFDAYCDAWFAAVRLPDGLHVGSLELVDPD